MHGVWFECMVYGEWQGCMWCVNDRCVWCGVCAWCECVGDCWGGTATNCRSECMVLVTGVYGASDRGVWCECMVLVTGLWCECMVLVTRVYGAHVFWCAFCDSFTPGDCAVQMEGSACCNLFNNTDKLQVGIRIISIWKIQNKIFFIIL